MKLCGGGLFAFSLFFLWSLVLLVCLGSLLPPFSFKRIPPCQHTYIAYIKHVFIFSSLHYSPQPLLLRNTNRRVKGENYGRGQQKKKEGKEGQETQKERKENFPRRYQCNLNHCGCTYTITLQISYCYLSLSLSLSSSSSPHTSIHTYITYLHNVSSATTMYIHNMLACMWHMQGLFSFILSPFPIW
ncbi:hypothetical protein F4810DRAFT_201676 [Camillea tinctor]|nr:hypothetical protein F4810DRAFT_201676 [Camillea tinctor]